MRHTRIRGAAANQYVLVVGLVAMIGLIALTAMGGNVALLLGRTANVMGNAASGTIGGSGETPPACNPNGSLDTGFLPGGSGFNGMVSRAWQQADGKVLAAGLFTSYNGGSQAYLVRLNPNGTVDPSFTLTGSGLNDRLVEVTTAPDGKILVGGYFTSYNGTARTYIARLNGDGTLDGSFTTTGSGFTGASAQSIVFQPDGKLIVGGHLTAYNGTFVAGVVRLNANGSLDSSFAPTGTGINGVVYIVRLQSDGKIVAVGSFNQYDSTPAAGIARLNSNGTLDGTFATGSGFNSIANALVILPDGKILVGGAFNAYNSAPALFLARLTSAGALDSSFAMTGTGLGGRVWAISRQTDGKLAVAGTFTDYNGIARPLIARLTADGALDASFVQTGSGITGATSPQVRTLFTQADGRILVGGQFDAYNGTATPNLLRIGCP